MRGSELQNCVGECGSNSSGPGPLQIPSVSPWIDWARLSYYSALKLQRRWRLGAAPFDSLSWALFYRPAWHWLEEVRFWDAACLLASKRSPGEVESALSIEHASEFWKRFARYHGQDASQLGQFLNRIWARQKERLLRGFESEALPEEFRQPAPWEKALRILSPAAPAKPPAYDSLGALNRPFLVQVLHTRICWGWNEGREALAALMIEPLQQWLRSKFQEACGELIADATTDALMDYLRQPEKYDPERGMSLESFLFQAAWRNACNLNRGEQRRKRWEKLRDPEYLTLLETEAADEPEAEEGREQSEAWLEEFLKLLNERDGQVMELLRKGIKDRSCYAEVLGLADRSEAEQRKEVIRVKHRLQEALRRWIRKKCQAKLGGRTSR